MKINAAISQYVASGHLEYLRHKWYGSSPCFRLTADIYKPQPLEFDTVAGVFLMLILGIVIGIIILFLEHVVYRYALPTLRTKPKGSIWRNRNLMFFSQKLYKFVNCYELVSPHHSAKELVNNLRTGQIMGLFQKSVKRKENEQRRRRKSKAQFFEMIQEIRRVQKAEKSMESMTTSMEILEANTAANRNILPETISFTTSFTSDAVSPHVSTTITTYTTNTTTATSTSIVSTTFLHSPSTTISSSISSATRRISTFLPIGICDRKSPPGITIDYIPGPNLEEDYEGMLIVNRDTQGKRDSEKSSLKRVKVKDERQEDGESKSSLNESHVGSPLRRETKKDIKEEKEEEEEKSLSKSSSKDSKKKKRKRKLERSSRIEHSVDDNGNGASVEQLSDKRETNDFTDNEDDDQREILILPEDTPTLSASPLPSAVSAPASLFGEESSCECDRVQGATSSRPSETLLTLPSLCHKCIRRGYESSLTVKDFQSKSKSLDDNEIQPPSDFMSPAVSPSCISGREFTSISFPCSPHVFESPSSTNKPNLHHFLSEGDDRWRDWESQQGHSFDRGSMGRDYEIFSPLGYQSSGSYPVATNPISPRRLSSEPYHLKNITKIDLWRMWQDSELELRQRLHMVEEERNILASQLSPQYKTPSEPEDPVGKEIFRRKKHEERIPAVVVDPSTCLVNLELEVPFEFRDTTAKDLKKSRFTRSLEEGRQNRSSVRGSNIHNYNPSSQRDVGSFKSKNESEREYNDYYRSVRSLEDSLLKDNDSRSEIRRRSRQYRTSKLKSSSRRRDSGNSRRCKSSLDSRRSRSLARGSLSESSDSPQIERMPVNPRDAQYYESRESQKKKSSPSPMGEQSDRSSISRDYRRRKAKLHKLDKAPFSSLPRNKPQYRRKHSNTLSYCSKSSSSDEDITYSSRQYTESSPLPLLQSLQRHSLGKQRTITQKPKPKPVDTFRSEFRQSRKSLRKVSPYGEQIPYVSRIPREGPCPTHANHSHGITQKTHGRSSFEIRDLTLGELY